MKGLNGTAEAVPVQNRSKVDFSAAAEAVLHPFFHIPHSDPRKS